MIRKPAPLDPTTVRHPKFEIPSWLNYPANHEEYLNDLRITHHHQFEGMSLAGEFESAYNAKSFTETLAPVSRAFVAASAMRSAPIPSSIVTGGSRSLRRLSTKF